MHRPYEQLGLPTSFARRFETAKPALWLSIVGLCAVSCLGFYLYEVNETASKGFELRALEKRLERARASVLSYEDQAAQLQAVASLQEKIGALGYVPVDQMEFIDPVTGGVAMR